LIGSQHCDEGPSLSGKLRQEFSRHPFAIHHDAFQAVQVSSLLIAREHGWQSNRQMLVSSMSSCE
jgi:hypothetical protein